MEYRHLRTRRAIGPEWARIKEFSMSSSRKTGHNRPPQSHTPKDSAVTTLIRFVAHSINRLRGKSDDQYLDTLYQRESITLRSPWKAVAVISDSQACKASKLLKDKRFLCAQAPKLPLQGCTEVHCSCRYKHFADRRAGPRRAAESGVHVHLLSSSPKANAERRASRGRRSTDG
jgi:hypothetical protein